MLYLLDPHSPDAPFPNVEDAEDEPNGLLAIGGDLSCTRLLNAYRHGIFPWYGDCQPILWWSPDPRMVLYPNQLRVSRSLKKTIRNSGYTVSMDQDFNAVVQACAAPRSTEPGTWITADMLDAYTRLHEEGKTHSIEVWDGPELVGGLYGVALGKVFFGESMFSRRSNTSKIALVHLVSHLLQWGYRLIDCQVRTEHLASLGATEISRRQFIQHLDQWCQEPAQKPSWNRPPEPPLLPG